jgi:hypothetical protein
MFRRIFAAASLVVLIFGIVTTANAQRTAAITGVATDQYHGCAGRNQRSGPSAQ